MNNEDEFRPGIYRHYKGRNYLALGLAREDETNETVVVYTRLYPRAGPPMSTRRLEVWNQHVVLDDGSTCLRFTYLGQQEPLTAR